MNMLERGEVCYCLVLGFNFVKSLNICKIIFCVILRVECSLNEENVERGGLLIFFGVV
jgi:hypothetical protein